MSPIELKPFCSTDEMRPNLHHPWSRGKFSYASNGHVMVRVPRLADVPENPDAPNPVKIFARLEEQTAFAPLPKIEMPHSDGDCQYCDGRGTEHECPSCNCQCERCEGSGEHRPMVSAELNGALYDARYLRLLASLPELRFSTEPPKDYAGHFIFSGGDGGLMPLRSAFETHITLPPPESLQP